MGECVISQNVIANLRSGLPIVYPTSTLPGLGGIPNKETLARVYDLKNRKDTMPVSLGVADLNQVKDLVIIPEIARILDYFPKGSLTLILKPNNRLIVAWVEIWLLFVFSQIQSPLNYRTNVDQSLQQVLTFLDKSLWKTAEKQPDY